MPNKEDNSVCKRGKFLLTLFTYLLLANVSFGKFVEIKMYHNALNILVYYYILVSSPIDLKCHNLVMNNSNYRVNFDLAKTKPITAARESNFKFLEL